MQFCHHLRYNCRENDYTTIAVSCPCIEGLVLVVSQNNAALKFRTGNEIEDIIREVEARCLQEIDDIPVIQGHSSEDFGSLIPGRIWDPDVSLNLDCAFIEGKLHGLIEPG